MPRADSRTGNQNRLGFPMPEFQPPSTLSLRRARYGKECLFAPGRWASWQTALSGSLKARLRPAGRDGLDGESCWGTMCCARAGMVENMSSDWPTRFGGDGLAGSACSKGRCRGARCWWECGLPRTIGVGEAAAPWVAALQRPRVGGNRPGRCSCWDETGCLGATCRL
jgi:hypothetical protein